MINDNENTSVAVIPPALGTKERVYWEDLRQSSSNMFAWEAHRAQQQYSLAEEAAYQRAILVQRQAMQPGSPLKIDLRDAYNFNQFDSADVAKTIREIKKGVQPPTYIWEWVAVVVIALFSVCMIIGGFLH